MGRLVATPGVRLPPSMPTCCMRERVSPREQKPAGILSPAVPPPCSLSHTDHVKPEPNLSVLGALSLVVRGWQCPEARPCLKKHLFSSLIVLCETD